MLDEMSLEPVAGRASTTGVTELCLLDAANAIVVVVTAAAPNESVAPEATAAAESAVAKSAVASPVEGTEAFTTQSADERFESVSKTFS